MSKLVIAIIFFIVGGMFGLILASIMHLASDGDSLQDEKEQMKALQEYARRHEK